MSFFDPSIYCKQNLKKQDKINLEWLHTEMLNVIAAAQSDYIPVDETHLSILQKIECECAAEFCENLKQELGFRLQELVVAIIDTYEEDVEPVEDPETYYYEQLKKELECEKEEEVNGERI